MNFKSFFQAILSFPRENKQKFMVVILFLLIIAIIFVVYFGITKSSRFGNKPDISETEEDELHLLDETIEGIKFDINFLDYLKDFEIYGTKPSIEAGEGKTNPFVSD